VQTIEASGPVRPPGAHLRVVFAEPGRPRLGDLVRERLPNALEVLLDGAHRPQPGSRDGKPSRAGRSPLPLLGDYPEERDIDDPRIPGMSAELLDEITESPEDAVISGDA